MSMMPDTGSRLSTEVAQLAADEATGLTSLPPAVIADIVSQLGPWARAQLRSTCRELRSATNRLLPLMLQCAILVPHDTAESSVGADVPWRAACRLLRSSSKCITSLLISLQWADAAIGDWTAIHDSFVQERILALGAAAADHDITSITLHTGGQLQLRPHLLSLLCTTWPSLQVLEIHSTDEGRSTAEAWEAALKTLPRSLHTLQLHITMCGTVSDSLAGTLNAASHLAGRLHSLSINGRNGFTAHQVIPLLAPTSADTASSSPSGAHLGVSALDLTGCVVDPAAALEACPSANLECLTVSLVNPDRLRPVQLLPVLLPAERLRSLSLKDMPCGGLSRAQVGALISVFRRLQHLSISSKFLVTEVRTLPEAAARALKGLHSLELSDSVDLHDLACVIRDLLGSGSTCKILLQPVLTVDPKDADQTAEDLHSVASHPGGLHMPLNRPTATSSGLELAGVSGLVTGWPQLMTIARRSGAVRDAITHLMRSLSGLWVEEGLANVLVFSCGALLGDHTRQAPVSPGAGGRHTQQQWEQEQSPVQQQDLTDPKVWLKEALSHMDTLVLPAAAVGQAGTIPTFGGNVSIAQLFRAGWFSGVRKLILGLSGNGPNDEESLVDLIHDVQGCFQADGSGRGRGQRLRVLLHTQPGDMGARAFCTRARSRLRCDPDVLGLIY